MAVINIFVPPFHARKFSGGLLTVFEYANGFVAQGHTVRVIPIEPSPHPSWFEPKFELMSPTTHLLRILSALPELLGALLRSDKAEIKQIVGQVMTYFARGASYSFRRARQIELLRGQVPPADISLATSYLTALPVYLYGSGQKYYFAQHYEPYFSVDAEDPSLAFIDALITYHFPDIQIIANSTWLAERLREQTGRHISICPNAIDHTVFFPEGSPPNPAEKFVVISYGGRLAKWKGFQEAAEAIRLARKKIPHLEWQVFGDAALPPDNSIAPYKSLGFITGNDLRRAYSAAHVLLASSWYESFPLFPLEAMACGTAVVTTPYGVEDYAQHMRNAYVVPPREPHAMAEAIVRLHADSILRQSLVEQGLKDARNFTWERSVSRMAELMGLK